MSEGQDHIEKKLKGRFSDFTLPPSANLWASLEAQLDERQIHKKRRWKIFRYLFVLTFLLGSVAAYFYVDNISSSLVERTNSLKVINETEGNGSAKNNFSDISTINLKLLLDNEGYKAKNDTNSKFIQATSKISFNDFKKNNFFGNLCSLEKYSASTDLIKENRGINSSQFNRTNREDQRTISLTDIKSKNVFRKGAPAFIKQRNYNPSTVNPKANKKDSDLINNNESLAIGYNQDHKTDSGSGRFNASNSFSNQKNENKKDFLRESTNTSRINASKSPSSFNADTIANVVGKSENRSATKNDKIRIEGDINSNRDDQINFLETNNEKLPSEEKNELINLTSIAGEDSSNQDILPNEFNPEEKSVLLSENEVKNKESVRRRSSFDLYFSPEMNYRKMYSNSPSAIDERTGMERPVIAMTAGLGVNIQLSGNLQIRTGLAISNYSEKFYISENKERPWKDTSYNSMVTDVVVGYNNGNPIYSKDTSYTMVLKDTSISSVVQSNYKNTYNYIGIPITLRYIISENKKINMDIVGGIITCIWIGGKREISQSSNMFIRENYSLLNKNAPFQPLAFILQAQLGISHNFTKRLSFMFNPGIKYFLTPVYKKSELVQTKPYTVGIEFGLRLKL